MHARVGYPSPGVLPNSHPSLGARGCERYSPPSAQSVAVDPLLPAAPTPAGGVGCAVEPIGAPVVGCIGTQIVPFRLSPRLARALIGEDRGSGAIRSSGTRAVLCTKTAFHSHRRTSPSRPACPRIAPNQSCCTSVRAPTGNIPLRQPLGRRALCQASERVPPRSLPVCWSGERRRCSASDRRRTQT